MDEIFVVIGLVLFAVPATLIYLVISHASVKKRLAQVERELAAFRRGAQTEEASPAPEFSAPSPEIPQTSTPQSPKAPDTPETKEAPPAAAVIEARAARIAQIASSDEAVQAPPSGLSRTVTQVISWLTVNWFYAVSALSLALAGLFLVQYGMENGFLPPLARVLAAMAFGAGLIAAGEYIRRRFGDEADASTAYLPSVFSGAGIVSLFGAVLSARLLYNLIGAEAALAGMVAVAGVALVLGWFYGPLLAAVGVIGAFSAPFVVGGSSSDPSMFYAYFALITALGLGIDTLKRWAWVSVLSVVLGYLTGWMLAIGAYSTVHNFTVYVMALAVMALLIPARSLWPDHAGPQLHQLRKNTRPIFPTLLAGCALAATSASLLITSTDMTAEFWLSVLGLAVLTGLWSVWSVRAPAIQDQALLPLAGLLGAVVFEGMDRGVVLRNFENTYRDAPEAAFPMTVTALVGVGLALSLVAAWRSLRAQDTGDTYAAAWAAGGALIGPGLAILLEVTWRPALTIGAYPWALHAAALGAVMVVLAERFARIDGENRLRTALFVLSALSALTFALVLILTLAALTAAIAVTVVVAAWLDRRFDLPQMGWFIAAGVATLGYRLVADPGLAWGLDTALPDMLLAYGGAFVAMLAGLWFLGPKERVESKLILGSAAWSMGGLLISLLLFRGITYALGDDDLASHWAMGLYATIWFGMALAQVQRIPARAALVWVRRLLAAGFALVGLGALALGVLLFSPLFSGYFADVAGPPLINTLLPAYLMPAAILALGAWRLGDAPPVLRRVMYGLAGALAALWVFCVIRHFWQGAGAMALDRGMGQYELYTYTVVLLVGGALVFYQSLARASALMRRAGLILIGLAVAKVFFVDISGLGGLTRVFSLLVLGLSLAGLAWLNRWAQERDLGRKVEAE